MSKNAEPTTPQYPFLQPNDPVCLIIKATLKPIGDTDRFQPAGFPEVGHVIYDAPRTDGNGNRFKEKVCIVDSPASMANHLETVCVAGAGSMELHSDLANLPFVVCQTDGNVDVVSTFTEGHRIASDYFVSEKDRPTVIGGEFNGTYFREVLRTAFGIVEVKKDKTYFIPPAKWWDIYKTIFKYDPNALVHGVMFAKEQIKISRLLTAHLEAFGACRVGRAGVKFDRLGKTTSGQPIFAVDEETANDIRATFIIDLALLRSYGRNENGLSEIQKRLLLDLALWKIKQLLARPFRYRTQCFLGCSAVTIETESRLLSANETPSSASENAPLPSLLTSIAISNSITACGFTTDNTTRVYYPAEKLYKPGKDDEEPGAVTEDESGNDSDDQEV